MRSIDLDGLRTFLKIAECGSFSVAASQLHLTQPAVSKRLQVLEETLDTQLFDRVGREVKLTEAGRLLRPRALEILHSVEATQTSIAALKGNISGSLSLATNHHIGLWHLPDMLARFSERYQDVQLAIHFDDSAVIYDLVLAGDHELGLITLSEQRHDVTQIPLWSESLSFACAAGHPLAEVTDVQMLLQHPAILPGESTFTGRIIKNYLSEHRLEVAAEVTTNYLEIIHRLVRAGLGWSLLPESMLDSSLVRIPLPDQTAIRTVGLIHHPRRLLSSAGAAFIQQVGDYARANRQSPFLHQHFAHDDAANGP